MLEGIFIEYGTTPKLDLNKKASGKMLESQKCLLNIGTESNTDFIFTERGTNLFREALSGVIYDTLSAEHSGNLAAVDSLFFVRENTVNIADPNRVTNIQLFLQNIYLYELSYQAVFTYTDGTTITEIIK